MRTLFLALATSATIFATKKRGPQSGACEGGDLNG